MPCFALQATHRKKLLEQKRLRALENLEATLENATSSDLLRLSSVTFWRHQLQMKYSRNDLVTRWPVGTRPSWRHTEIRVLDLRLLVLHKQSPIYLHSI